MLTGTIAKTDVVLLILIGWGLSWATHRFLTSKAGGKSRIGRGTGYVDDGRKLLKEGRALFRKSLLFVAGMLVFGAIFFKLLARIMLL